MRRLFYSLAAIVLLALAPAAAFASPLSYVNTPFDTPQQVANAVISSINSNMASAAPLVTASGTTTATAAGLRTQVSITGLTTAAGVTATAMTVTNTSVVAASQVFCSANGYAGTGNPVVVNVVPGVGSFTMQVQNTHASAALNATVPISCIVFN